MLDTLIAECHGMINAGRGSGKRGIKGWQLGAMAITAFSTALPHGVVFATVATILFLLPMAVYFEGTGGMMQAQKDQTINNPQEWPPLDWVCHQLTEACLGYGMDETTEAYPRRNDYCRLWGFFFASGVALIFMTAFLITNPLYALALIFFPFACRYINWRIVEFLFLSVYSGLFVYSIKHGGAVMDGVIRFLPHLTI